MRRTVIAAAWVMGATIPLLLATVFVVGCCVLPFHGVMHRLMPICTLATNLMRGHDHGQQSAPAREKQEPVKRFATELPQPFRLSVAANVHRVVAPRVADAYRSFISLGAVRCDQDIGLHLLDQTFLI